MLEPLLKTLPIQDKLLLYNSCILPIITYTCPVWSFTLVKHQWTISAVYSRLRIFCLRTVRNGSRCLPNCTKHRDLRTTTLRKRIIDLSNIFDLPYEIIPTLPYYDASEPEHRERPKFPLFD